MTFETYQIEALRTATYILKGKNMVYPAIKLAGEAGELADKIGKYWRNNSVTLVDAYKKKHVLVPINSEAEKVIVANCMDSWYLTNLQREACALELGDILWYICALAKELGYDINKIAQMNIEKLKDRAERDVINSEGDYR
jgi:NTP pyrophosphatase (non-canonical NTP hydrolase)